METKKAEILKHVTVKGHIIKPGTPAAPVIIEARADVVDNWVKTGSARLPAASAAPTHTATHESLKPVETTGAAPEGGDGKPGEGTGDGKPGEGEGETGGKKSGAGGAKSKGA